MSCSNVVKQWQCEGYPCVITKHSNWGFLCGYVGVTKEHPDYDKQYHDVDYYVHGGLTFSEKGGWLGQPDDLWFFGFDCGHFGDFVPALQLYGTYRDEAYVAEQCELLVEQLEAKS